MPDRGCWLAALTAAFMLGVPAVATAASPQPAPVVPLRVCDEAHLRAAIASAPQDATIRWQCDGTITVTPEGGGTIQIIDQTGQRRLTLDGAGRRAVISSRGGTALRVGGPQQVTLRRLTFADGSNMADVRTIGGGAVTTFTPLVVDRVTFRGNQSFNGGGAISMRTGRGALHIQDSIFEDNAATCTVGNSGTDGGGGAINVKGGGPTTIVRTVFRGNRVTGSCVGGGALAAPQTFRAIEAGPITITDSRFTANTAEVAAVNVSLQTGGGAIVVYNRTLSIAGSRFEGNDVTGPIFGSSGGAGLGFGGAVYVDQQTNGMLPPLTTQITTSVFDGNEPSVDVPGYEHSGGALAFRDLQGTPIVQRTLLRSNRADQGGAIYTAGPLTVDQSLIAENSATESGGALMIGPQPVTITRSLLLDNQPDACAVGADTHQLALGPLVFERPGTSCAALAASSG